MATDYTAIINASIAAGQQLGPGTFTFAGTINGMPRGQGASKTLLLATSASAKIVAGAALGSSWGLSTNDTRGGFKLDGAGIAGASAPLLFVNTLDGTYLPIQVVNSLGDGVVIAGANNTFLNLSSFGHVGCSLAFDSAAFGNTLINAKLLNAGRYHLEFRQTIASPNTGFSVPSQNRLINPFLQGANGGLNLGCLHHLAGSANHLESPVFSTAGTSVPLIYLEVNTVSGRSADTNGTLYIRDGTYSGGTFAIASGSTALTSSPAVILQGSSVFGFQTGGSAISWSNATPIRQDGTATGLTYSGSGAAPTDISYGYLPPSPTPVRITSSGAVSIPTGARNARITACGGGGGGGGGGSASATQLQAGGGGGGPGALVTQLISLTGVSGLTATIGGGGGGGVGGAAGGSTAFSGSTGGNTTLTGTGLNTITAVGGSGGGSSGASSVTGGAGGIMGTLGTNVGTQGISTGGVAQGGPGGKGGGSAIGLSGSGGGGGGAATATNGGSGGSPGVAQGPGGSSGSSGGSGASAGGTPANAAANSGAGGGGGGGGAAGTGAGGSGGSGGSGFIEITWLP